MPTVRKPHASPQGVLIAPVTDAPPSDPNARGFAVGPFAIIAHFDGTFEPGQAPQDLDVRSHPHIGIATLTYLLEGAVTHRDGLGNTVEIRPGDAAWMIAGAGIVHSERIPHVRQHGGRQRGFQIWVALSEAEEDCAPSFELTPAAGVHVIERAGATVRVVLGEDANLRAPASAFGPVWFHDVRLAAGAEYTAPASEQGALYVIEGHVDVDGTPVRAREVAAFGAGEPRQVRAVEPTRLVGFGGSAITPRYLWWNFMHSKRERIEEAKAVWRDRRIAIPADDAGDVIPLVADHERPLRRLNA